MEACQPKTSNTLSLLVPQPWSWSGATYMRGLGGHVHAAVACVGWPIPRSRMIKSVALACMDEPIGLGIRED